MHIYKYTYIYTYKCLLIYSYISWRPIFIIVMIIIEVELILLEGSVNRPAAYLDMHILLYGLSNHPIHPPKIPRKVVFFVSYGLVDEALRCWSWL